MIYTYRCNTCDHIQDASRSIAERDNAPNCEDCGGDMRKILTPVEVNGYFLGGYGNPGYMCPVTEQWVDSKRKRNRIMKEHDLLEKG